MHASAYTPCQHVCIYTSHSDLVPLTSDHAGHLGSVTALTTFLIANAHVSYVCRGRYLDMHERATKTKSYVNTWVNPACLHYKAYRDRYRTLRHIIFCLGWETDCQFTQIVAAGSALQCAHPLMCRWDRSIGPSATHLHTHCCQLAHELLTLLCRQSKEKHSSKGFFNQEVCRTSNSGADRCKCTG